jgi:glycosyltransferase involved in cell wall biosynthesis
MADKLIVLSEHSKSIFEKAVKDSTKIEVIHNFSQKLVATEKEAHSNYWLYVGRLSAEKGIRELLSSWPKGETLRVYGSGELEQELKTTHASNSDIEFMGFLNEKDKGAVFSGAIALVFPSTCMETSPLVMSEAFSIGTPILAYSENVVGHLVSRSGGGVSFSAFNYIEDSIKELRGTVEIKSVQATRLYEELFSPAVWLRETMNVYNQFSTRH